jgi:hypothetical protein
MAARGSVRVGARSEVVLMKGGRITGGAGAASSVTPFMLQNLTKSLSESAERGERAVRSRSGSGRRERVKQEVVEEAERERERERVRVERERDGVVVCKARAGGVQWKYVSKDGRAGEKAMQVMHAKQHRDPVAVGFLALLAEF